MPVLVTSTHPTVPEPLVTEVTFESGGMSAYSHMGRRHAQMDPPSPNEDNFFIATVAQAMLPHAEAAKEMLRQLRDEGAEKAKEVRKGDGLQDASATLAAVATYGDWSVGGNPAERGFALICPGDSGIAWHDKATGRIVQLTRAQESVALLENPNGGEPILRSGITNYLGRYNLRGEQQDRADQLMAFSESELAAQLKSRGINSVDGELIIFSDGIVQTAQHSSVLDSIPAEHPDRRKHQDEYDAKTTQYQEEKIEELGRRQNGNTNKSEALIKEALTDGSRDDLTVVTVEIPPPPGSSAQTIVYLCDGAGGHAGGWQASNSAVMAAGTLLSTMEHRHIEESRKRGNGHSYNQFDPYEVIASSVGSWSFGTSGTARIDFGPTPNLAMMRALACADIDFFDAQATRPTNYYMQVSGQNAQTLKELVDPGTILRNTMGCWEPVGQEQHNGSTYHPGSSAAFSAVTNALTRLGFHPDNEAVPAGDIHLPKHEALIQKTSTAKPIQR